MTLNSLRRAGSPFAVGTFAGFLTDMINRPSYRLKNRLAAIENVA